MALGDIFGPVEINRTVGKFKFDCTVEESHQSDLEVAEHPIESGGNIADNAVLAAKEITIRGIIVDYEVNSVSSIIAGVNSLPQTGQIIADVISGKMNPFDPKTQQKLLSDAVDFVGDNIMAKVRNIAPWLPNVLGSALDLGHSDSRIRTKHDELYRLQSSGELLEVVTATKIYKDMVIKGISSITKKDTVTEYILTLREVQVTAEQLVKSQGLTGGAADMTSKSGKGKGKGGKSGVGDDIGAEGKADAVKPKVTKHQSVVERMRGQVEAEKAKLAGRFGF